MQKKRMWGAAVLLLFTAAVVGASSLGPAERKNVPPAESGASAEPMLPGLEISALETNMPAADWAAFEAYLPVLWGEQTFRWVSVVRPGCAGPEREPLDVTIAAYCDERYGDLELEEPPEALTLYCLAVQDIDGDGGAELVLHFRDLGGHYLVLHREDETVWGAVYIERGFQMLQKNGVYAGSGGAGYTYYYQTSFRDGVFEERKLGHKLYDGNGAFDCELDGQEVAEAIFDAWLAENMAGDVIWYAPDGGVLPGSM